MKKRILATGLFLLILAGRGYAMDIQNLLQKAENDVTDLTVIWDLKQSNSFQILEKSANKILEESLYFLQLEELSNQRKMILLLALQNSKFDNYKIFLNRLSLLYVERKVNEYVMRGAIVPYDWDYKVRENFSDPEIKNALKACLLSKSTSTEFVSVIKDVLSGKSWRNYQRRMR